MSVDVVVDAVGPPSEFALLDGDVVIERLKAFGADQAFDILDSIRPGWRTRYRLFINVHGTDAE